MATSRIGAGIIGISKIAPPPISANPPAIAAASSPRENHRRAIVPLASGAEGRKYAAGRRPSSAAALLSRLGDREAKVNGMPIGLGARGVKRARP